MDYTKKIYYYIDLLNGRKNAIIRRLIGDGSSKKYFEELKSINECFAYLVENGFIEQIDNFDEMQFDQRQASLNDGDSIYKRTNKKFE